MRCVHFALAVALAATLAPRAATAGHLQVFDQWGRFKRTSSPIVSPHQTDTVKIERASDGLTSPAVWLLERTTEITGDQGHSLVVRWADSGDCPALIPTLAKLADLESVAIQPPGVPFPKGRDVDPARARQQRLSRNDPDADWRIFDGADYEIAAQGHWPVAHMYGEVVLRGGAGTPAQTWVEQALRALEPCWTTTQP
jgi:hypothetical protein